jgi:hypothetical protein
VKQLRKFEALCRGHVSVYVSESPDNWGRGFEFYYIQIEQGGSSIEISRDDIPNLIEALQAMQKPV